MARIAENTVIFDGQEYKPGDVIPDFKSIKCVDTREPRKYQGLSADVSVLNDVIAKYASGGASCFMSDTGEYYEYDREEKTWKLITNITERGFDSEKAYGALKHMLNLKNEVIDTSVKSWLDNHPEATTTVQDESIEEIKINKNFLPWIKKDYVTPQMFGAKGDSVTDDTEAFQKCVTFALTNETPIFVPSGKYYITDSIYFGMNTPLDWAPAMKISGTITRSNDMGRSTGAELICSTNKPIFMLNLNDNNEVFKTNAIMGFDISNIRFRGADGYEATGIRFGGFCRAKFHDISGYNLKSLIDEPENIIIDGKETVNYPDVIELKSLHIENPMGTQLVIRHADIGILERIVIGGKVNSSIDSLILIDSCSAISIRDMMFGISSDYDNTQSDESYLKIISSTVTIENLRVENPAFRYVYNFNSSDFVVLKEVIWYDAYNTIVFNVYNSKIKILSSEHRGIMGDFKTYGVEPSKISIDEMFKVNDAKANFSLKNDKIIVIMDGHTGICNDCYKYTTLKYNDVLGHLVFVDEFENDLTVQYGYPTLSSDKKCLEIKNTPSDTHNILAFCKQIFTSKCKYTIDKEVYGETNDKIRYKVYKDSTIIEGSLLEEAIKEIDVAIFHI